MNLLKQFWSWFATLCTDNRCEVTAVEAEEFEDTLDIGSIFGHMCREAGVKNRDLISTDAIALFVEWYDGPADEGSIRDSVSDFKKAHPLVSAKIGGKI